MRVAHRQRSDAAFPRGFHRLRQSAPEGGLGEAISRVDLHHAGAGASDDRLHIAFHPTRKKLHAVTFKIVETANPVPHRLRFPHRACDLRRNPRDRAMTLQRRAGGRFDLIQSDLRHGLHPQSGAESPAFTPFSRREPQQRDYSSPSV